MSIENVFVTVGTTKFDKLIQTILHPESIKALKCRGCKRIKLQIGRGNYVPEQDEIEGVQITYYQYKDSIHDDISEADLVISHAGAGSCLETLELEKLLLVVVNEDLMSNHQFEVARKLSELKYLHYTTCANFINTVRHINFKSLRPYPKHSPILFVKAIDCMMGFSS